jgi:DNA-binding MarR family transcriptional regulator
MNTSIHLDFMIRMKRANLATNHASIILCIGLNDGCEQKTMKGFLHMNPTVISAAMRLLVAMGYVRQARNNVGANNRGVRTKHHLTDRGFEVFHFLNQ